MTDIVPAAYQEIDRDVIGFGCTAYEVKMEPEGLIHWILAENQVKAADCVADLDEEFYNEPEATLTVRALDIDELSKLRFHTPNGESVPMLWEFNRVATEIDEDDLADEPRAIAVSEW